MNFVTAKNDFSWRKKQALSSMQLLYRAPIINISINSGNKYVRIYTAMIHNGIITYRATTSNTP